MMTARSEHGPKLAERALLGAALRDRVDGIVDRVCELASDAGGGFDETIEDTFRAGARAATCAVADWISHGDADFESEADFDAAASFADMARFRCASVHEVAKRCLRWRDCIASVLLDEADLLEISRGAVHEALWMTLHGFDVTLVRMCEAYEVERQTLLEDLARRR
jgi:hypothetical protein